MKKTVIGLIVVLALAGVAVLAVSQKNDNEDKNSSNTVKVEKQPGNNDTANEAPAANTITYTNSGFQPASLSVQSGSKVTIKNNSSRPLQFDSNPHPAHTDDPELNVGLVSAGESVTITVVNKGDHGYHNHLSPDDTGSLLVE